MNSWIKGNIPSNCKLYYWVTLKDGNGETYCCPCKYYELEKQWKSVEGVVFDSDQIVAYNPIYPPVSYTKIGNGYFIRILDNQDEYRFYARNAQPIIFSNVGYSTLDRAKTAIRRMRRVDKERDHYCYKRYDIVDGNGNVVWELK